MPAPVFRDRHDAGKQLAEKLAALPFGASPAQAPLVLGLPRGGVPVASEVATRLGAPLDVLPVRKLGLPDCEEYAVGAIASLNGDLVTVIDDATLQARPETQGVLDQVIRREWAELLRRRRAYRGTRPALHLTGREVVLVDDGLATGATMRAAVRAARKDQARRITVAVPVAASDALATLRREADACLCVVEAHDLGSVGRWYANFQATDDAEVVALLDEAERRQAHRLVAP